MTNQRRPTLVLQQVGRVGNGSNLKAMIMKRNNFNMPAEKKPEIPPAPARRPSIPYFRGQKPPELIELEKAAKKEMGEDGVSEETES